MDRREFFKHTAAAGAGTYLVGGAPASARSLRQSPNEKVRFACIGVGGKGDSDTNDAGRHGEIVALCDIDSEVLDKMGEKVPQREEVFRLPQDARGDGRQDRRRDGQHARPHPRPGQRDGHADGQALLLPEAADLVDRGSAADADARRREEALHPDGQSRDRRGRLPRRGRADPIGDSGTDQGHLRLDQSPDLAAGHRPAQGHAGHSQQVPLDEFLGAAPDRPYHPDYQPFKWRGWLDFGTGALGDMACHTINIAAMALELFDPESVEVVDTSGIVDHESYPVWSIIRTQFGPRNGRGPAQPDLVRRRRQVARGKADLQGTPPRRERLPGSGLLLVGEKGSFFSVNDYGAEHTLLPKDKFKEVAKPKRDPAALAGPFQGMGRRHQGRRSDQGHVELRLRRPAHRDRAPGRGRPQGRHRHRVGPRGHEGQERPVGRSVHPARLSQGLLDPLKWVPEMSSISFRQHVLANDDRRWNPSFPKGSDAIQTRSRGLDVGPA